MRGLRLGNWISYPSGQVLCSIYAFTVSEYIREPTADPVDRLDKVTGSQALSKLATDSLDNVYALILQDALRALDEDEIAGTLRCLATLVCVCEPLSAIGMSSLLEIHPSNIRRASIGLHSLPQMPHNNNDGAITTFHASFPDYLLDRRRSGTYDWYVDSSTIYSDLFSRCLNVMARGLHFNVSLSKTSHHSNKRHGQKPAELPRHLVYACCFWVEHLQAAPSPWTFLDEISDILHDKFLYWLEVLMMVGWRYPVAVQYYRGTESIHDR